MKLFIFSTSILLCFSLLTACKKEIIIIPAEVSPNKPPGQFSITLDHVSWNSASITWTQSVDPDLGAVSYRVFLNDSLIISDLQQRTFTFNDLHQTTTYVVKVIAYDDKDAQAAATIDFITLKLDQRFFLRTIEYGKIGQNQQQMEGMAKGNDGGYVITGKSDMIVYGTPGGKLFAMKIDSLGNKMWTKVYNYISRGGGVKITNCNGGYLIVSGSQLLKIDNDGELVWEREVLTINDAFIAASVDKSDNIYVAGSLYNDSAKNKVAALLCKFDTNGNLLWKKSYSPTIWDLFLDIKVGSDGNLILLGMTDKNNISIGEHNANTKNIEYDYWVVKLSDDGNMIWNKIYHHEGAALTGTIIETNDGNYVFTGATSNVYAQFHCILQKIDTNGNTQWSYEDIGAWMYGRSVAENDDNSLVVAGELRSNYNSDFALYKFDKNGSKLWQKIYEEDFTYIMPKTVFPTDDGGYFINAGKTKTYYTGDERDQIYVFKTDALGNFN